MPVYAGVGGVRRELSPVYAGVGGVNRELASWQGCVGGVNRELLGFVPQATLGLGTLTAMNGRVSVSSSGLNRVEIDWDSSVWVLDVAAVLHVANHREGISYRIRLSLESGNFFVDDGGGTGGCNFYCNTVPQYPEEPTADEFAVPGVEEEFPFCHADAFDVSGLAPIWGVPDPIRYVSVEIATSEDGYERWYELPCEMNGTSTPG